VWRLVRVYPEPKGPDEPKWQSERALVSLTGGYRDGRTGSGLKLTTDRAVQAWARKHQATASRTDALGEERIHETVS